MAAGAHPSGWMGTAPLSQVTVIDDCLGEGNGLFKQMEDAAVRRDCALGLERAWCALRCWDH